MPDDPTEREETALISKMLGLAGNAIDFYAEAELRIKHYPEFAADVERVLANVKGFGVLTRRGAMVIALRLDFERRGYFIKMTGIDKGGLDEPFSTMVEGVVRTSTKEAEAEGPVVSVPFTISGFPPNRPRLYASDYEAAMAIRELEHIVYQPGFENRFIGHRQIVLSMLDGFRRGVFWARDIDFNPMDFLFDIFPYDYEKEEYETARFYVWRIFWRWQLAYETLNADERPPHTPP